MIADSNDASSLLALVGAVVVGCSAPPPQRLEPARDGGLVCAWNHRAFSACYAEAEGTMRDGNDPRWPFCAYFAEHGVIHPGGDGSADTVFRYDEDGGIDEIEWDCDEGQAPSRIYAERDDQGRVERWVIAFAASEPRPIELEYDAAGRLAAQSWSQTTGISMTTDSRTEFEYDQDGRLITRRHETVVDGAPDATSTMTFSYDDGLLVAADRLNFNGCERASRLERGPDGRLEVNRESFSCDPDTDSVVTYDWDGSVLVGARFDFVRRTDHVRYFHDESGRIVEMHRDDPGGPFSTSFFEYDDLGRVEHVTWWGHHEPSF